MITLYKIKRQLSISIENSYFLVNLDSTEQEGLTSESIEKDLTNQLEEVVKLIKKPNNYYQAISVELGNKNLTLILSREQRAFNRIEGWLDKHRIEPKIFGTHDILRALELRIKE